MSARPREGLGGRGEASFYWVAFDVAANTVEFSGFAYQMIVAFVLPKNAFSLKNLVRAVCGDPLEWPEPASRIDIGRNQQMHMVRHNHERVQGIAVQSLTLVERVHHSFRNLGHAEKERPCCGTIQKPVHCNKGLAAGELLGREDPPGWQAASQPKRDKQRLTGHIPMRQFPRVLSHIRISVIETGKFSVGQAILPAAGFQPTPATP